MWTNIIVNTLPMASLIAMGLLLLILLLRYFAEPALPGLAFGALIRRIFSRSAPPDPLPVVNDTRSQELLRDEPALHRHARLAGWIFAMMALSRVIIILAVIGGAAWQGQETLNSLFTNFNGHWVRWDAPHYMDIAKNWYVAEGESRLFIVFLPLYPLLVRGLQPLFAGNTVAAAVFLSNLCLFASGWVLYYLVYDQHGTYAARRAVRYLMFCPLSVFFSAPYTESLFLLLTLLAVFLARRKKFLPAVIAGALAALSRTFGILTAVPIYYEMLRHVSAQGPWRDRRGKQAGLIAKYTLLVSLVATGTLAYLFLNWHITGNPLQFLEYQHDHWGQNYGTLWNTLRYTLEYAFSGDTGAFWQFGIWVPQAVALIAVLALLGCVAHRMNPGDGAYTWLYLYAAFAPTWSISGARYLGALYALFPMLVLITRKKWQDAMITVVLTALMAVCGYMYAVVGNLL